MFDSGFADLTMAEIASRANCWLRTLYGLAPSRDELVLAVVDRNLWRVGRKAMDAISSWMIPTEAIQAYLEAATEAVSDMTERFARDLATMPAAQRLGDFHADYLVAITRRLLEMAIERGEIVALDTGAAARVMAGRPRSRTLKSRRHGHHALFTEAGRRLDVGDHVARHARTNRTGADMSDIATTLRDDLLAEQAALDDLVSSLPDNDWQLPTPSPGWSVGDQIGHLTYFDGAAAMAITDPPAFKVDMEQLYAGAASAGDDFTLGASRALAPHERLEAWRANRRLLVDA